MTEPRLTLAEQSRATSAQTINQILQKAAESREAERAALVGSAQGQEKTDPKTVERLAKGEFLAALLLGKGDSNE